MATRYFTGTIAGIPLEESSGIAAGFQLIGADAWEANYTGNIVHAADGYPHTQTVGLFYGMPLEIRFIHIPQSLLRGLLDAIKATLPTEASFPCSFTDGFQTISANFKPNLPDWYSRGEVDGAYIKDAILRLISTGA